MCPLHCHRRRLHDGSSDEHQRRRLHLISRDTELSNAVTLGGVGFNIARAIVPALGGVIVAVIGPGAAFLLNAGMFLITLVFLIRWKSPRQSSALPSERVVGALRAGLRYLRHAPPLQAVLVRLAVFISCGSALWALLPLVAQHDLNLGGYLRRSSQPRALCRNLCDWLMERAPATTRTNDKGRSNH
ncbi:MAG TPA: MFS transporter [Ktedonobacteraceae bacterium]|nr:MFS transporter [Ktedonobacteraceae bacterium]